MGKICIEGSVLVTKSSAKQNIYIYIAYIIHVRALSYTYKHIYVHARENYFKELAHSIVVWQVQNLQCSPAGWRADVSDVQKTLWKKHGIKLRTVLQKTSGKIEAIRKIYIIGYRYFTKPLYTVVFFSIADGVIVTWKKFQIQNNQGSISISLNTKRGC